METKTTELAQANENAGALSLEQNFTAGMPASMQVLFDEKLFAKVDQIAQRMSRAQGITPKHLLGKSEACFAIVCASLNWRLDPFAVAKATYQTPGGQVGHFGALITAIIEQSGRLEPRSGGVRYEFVGEWDQIEGRFEIAEGRNTDDNGEKKKYARATWNHADAAKSKAGVIVRARLRGEKEDREFTFYLSQAFPLNSTLWATDPKTQICYLATRRFASLRLPGVLMGFADPQEADDAPAGTVIDMGDAQRVEDPAPEITMPQAKKREDPPPAAAQASSSPDPKPAPAGGEAPASSSPPPDAAPVNNGTLTDGQCRILRAKMKSMNVDEPEIEKMFGAPLERLAFEQFAEVQKFIAGGK